jgi:hypothetical protein
MTTTRDPLDLLTAAMLVVVGLIPVFGALEDGRPWGPAPTIGLAGVVLGLATLASELVRLARRRRASRS